MRIGKKTVKQIAWIFGIIGLVVIGFYLFAFVSGTPQPVSVVASESMEPNINKGDLVFCHNKDPSKIKNGSIQNLEGDVIIYDAKGLWRDDKLPPDGGYIMHRVVGKYYNETDGKYYFYAKGDNNKFSDPPYFSVINYSICEDRIKGVVYSIVPHAGNVILWLQNPVNMFPILMVVGIIVIVKLHHNSDSKDDMETYCQYHPNEDECKDYTVELDDLFKKKED